MGRTVIFTVLLNLLALSAGTSVHIYQASIILLTLRITSCTYYLVGSK